jgi:hypothetical protein
MKFMYAGRPVQRELSGVVAIGLTQEEEHVHRFTRLLGFANARPLMYDAIQASLVWIDRLTSETHRHQ